MLASNVWALRVQGIRLSVTFWKRRLKAHYIISDECKSLETVNSKVALGSWGIAKESGPCR
jgi:hypothetical protein